MRWLNEAQKEALERNGFVVVPCETYEGMAEAYEGLKKDERPIFVTTDALLHTTHLFFDYLLRVVEWTAARSQWVALTETLLEAAALDVAQARDRQVKEAAQRNLAFFAVGARLLDPSHKAARRIPRRVRRWVEDELALVNAHESKLPPPRSPVLGIREDYSQYVPRGHYTRNETFRTYFLAAMWYARMGFFFYPSESHGLQQKDTERLARQVLLIVRALHAQTAEGRPAIEVWRGLYETTALFAGRAEDPGPDEVIALAQTVYGSAPGAGALPDLRALADDERLAAFLGRARELPRPKVLSTYYLARGQDTITPRWQDGTLGFHLLPQRFVPDTHIFSELVWDRVGNYTGPDSLESGPPFTLYRSHYDGPYRAVPRGLDVLAAFGSALAAQILKEEGDTQYEGYREKLAELQALYAGGSKRAGIERPGGDGPQDLYQRWMDVLRALLKAPPAGAPDLFRGAPWARKSLNAALGAWTELRHDTILYVKQSYTSTPRGLSLPPPPLAYVEPHPQVYRRLGTMVAHLREQLDRFKLLISPVRGCLIEFEALLDELRVLAMKELRGEPLDDGEMSRLTHIGDWLQSVLEFPAELMEQISSGTDDRMALVADVHTHIEGDVVLQEAVGSPSLICVQLQVDVPGDQPAGILPPDEGQPTEFWGAVFDCYEFKHPLDDRLTDEAWQEMKERPARPLWTKSFIVE